MVPKVIPEITREDTPRVAKPHKVIIPSLGNGIWQMVFHCGYKEQLDVAEVFRSQTMCLPEIDLDLMPSFVEPGNFVKTCHRKFQSRWRRSQFSWPACGVERELADTNILFDQLV